MWKFLSSALVFLSLASSVEAGPVPGRYIVELNTDPAAKPARREAHRAAVRSEQQGVRRRLEARRTRVLGSVDTVANALFVEASAEEVAALAATPGVKRVLPVRTLRRTLDRAVVLTHTTEAWGQIGVENAGAGIKIAIIDSGIDVGHKGLQDPSLKTPPSYPKVTNESDLVHTNSKVIVARSYVSLLPRRDADLSARDRVGHGTSVAMIAAGVRNAGPLATIEGVAPKAYLGNYKVFGSPGTNDNTTEDIMLKAMDDAIADGMDVINLSLGYDVAPRLDEDLGVQAIQRAAEAGVIVVVATGNNGPHPNTIASPATAPLALAVGATSSDRSFSTSVEVPGIAKLRAITGDGPAPAEPVAGVVFDVSKLDGDGRACGSLPADALKARIALILRGVCTFEAKLTNAKAAGAIGAIVYAAQDSPNPIGMATGAAGLPAEMISHADGAAIKQALDSQPELTVTLRFTLDAVPVAGNRLTDFSGLGPSVDLAIKPDLVAPGGTIYSATQSFDRRGEMFSADGYLAASGTSFAAPVVAGAAALLRAARPGLTVEQYRSLLINAAADAEGEHGGPAGTQSIGAGLLDVSAALHLTAAAFPTSLSFGAGGADAQVNRTLRVTNIGAAAERFEISVRTRNGTAQPAPGLNSLELAPGASAEIPVRWSATGLTAGAYDGTIEIAGTSSGTRTRIPYWYAAKSSTPAHITVLDVLDTGRPGSIHSDAILFRITDPSGVPMPEAKPEVTVLSGGGSVRRVASFDKDVPGLMSVDIQLGVTAGNNVFRIQIGDLIADVPITGR